MSKGKAREVELAILNVMGLQTLNGDLKKASPEDFERIKSDESDLMQYVGSSFALQYHIERKDILAFQKELSIYLPSKENVPSSFAKTIESELEKLADKYEIEISFEPKTKLEAPAEESSA